MNHRKTPGTKILAIGDSHSEFWAGGRNAGDTAPSIDILHVGPATAFNLMQDDASVPTKARVRAYLDLHGADYGLLLLCFGEIDCRVHIVKQAIAARTSIDQVVADTIHRYLAFARMLMTDYNIPCVFWGPIASSPPDSFSFNADFPATGSIWERNYAAKSMNDALSAACQGQAMLVHISLFDMMLDARNVTIPGTLADGCHLTTHLFPVGLSLLRGAIRTLGLDIPLGGEWLVAPQSFVRNVAIGAAYAQSSRHGTLVSAPFGDLPDAGYIVHTNLENYPWIILDLSTGYILESIVLFNRTDGYQERARSISVDISLDKADWTTIHASDPNQPPFDPSGKLTIGCSHPGPIRFVRIYLREMQYLHLSCVRVLAHVFC